METFGLVSASTPPGSMLPINPRKLRKARKPEGVKDFAGWLKDTAQKYIDFDPAAKRQRHHQVFLTNEFWQSRQYGFFKSQNNWLTPDIDEDGIFYQCDYFSEQVVTQLGQWCATQIELIVNADENSSEGQLAANAGSDIVGYYTRKFNTPINDQILGLDAILNGTYFLYTYFDPECDSEGRVEIPKFGQRSIPNPSQMYQCLSCGTSGQVSGLSGGLAPAPAPVPDIDPAPPGMPSDAETPADEMQEQGQSQPQVVPPQQDYMCPGCASPLQMIGPAAMTQFFVNGSEEFPVGTLNSRIVNMMEVELAPSARGGQVETSPYLIYDRMVLKSVVEDAFYWMDNVAPTHPQKHHRYIRSLERQVGSFSGTATAGYTSGGTMHRNDMVNLVQVWFDTDLYKPYVFDIETKFENGLTVPPNTPLIKVFPDGIYLCLVNGEIADIRNENKNDHWVGGVWKPVPCAAYGIGVQSALWQQRLLNDMYNMGVESLKHLAVPQRLFNASVFDGGMMSGNPRNIIPIENQGPDADLSKLIHVVQAPGQNNAIPQFINQARSDMQAGTLVNNSLMGQATPNATAQDATAARDQSVQTAGLPMKIKGQVMARRGEQILKLFRKHALIERTLPIEVQNDFNRIEMKKLSAMDIDRRLFVTFAEHSTVPRNAGDRRKDVLNAELAGVWDETKPPKVRRLLAGVFQVPVSGDGPGQQVRKAEDRFCEIQKQVIKFRAYQKMSPQGAALLLQPDPLELAQNPKALPVVIKEILNTVPIDLEFDDHDAQQMWIVDWGNSDRGYGPDIDPLLRAVMKARFHEHRDTALQVKQSQSADAALANAPQIAAAAQAGQQLGGAALPVKKHLDPKGSLMSQQQ
jgi:hypothetical protein